MSELFQTNASIEKVPKLVTSDSLYLLSHEQNEKLENKPKVMTFGGSNTLERFKTKRTSREIKNENFDIDELVPDLDNQIIAIEDNNQLNDPSIKIFKIKNENTPKMLNFKLFNWIFQQRRSYLQAILKNTPKLIRIVTKS